MSRCHKPGAEAVWRSCDCEFAELQEGNRGVHPMMNCVSAGNASSTKSSSSSIKRCLSASRVRATISWLYHACVIFGFRSTFSGTGFGFVWGIFLLSFGKYVFVLLHHQCRQCEQYAPLLPLSISIVSLIFDCLGYGHETPSSTSSWIVSCSIASMVFGTTTAFPLEPRLFAGSFSRRSIRSWLRRPRERRTDGWTRKHFARSTGIAR